MEFTTILALVRTMLEWKYLIIIAAMFLDGTISPIPGEVVLILAGYLLYLGQMNFLLTVLSAVLGSLLAAILLYELSRRYGERIIRRYGRYLFLSERRLAQAERWFRKYGERTVFIGRLLPVVSQLISIPAGIAKMNRLKFLLYTAAGSAIWYSLVTAFSWWLGSRWDIALLFIKPFQLAALLIIGCVAIAVIVRKLFGRQIDRFVRRT